VNAGAAETQAVGVLGLGLWLPGHPDLASFSAGTFDALATAPQGASLGRVNRRRAGPLGRALADVTAEAMAAAAVDPATVPVVIGSAIGEAATMIGILDQMWRHPEPLSPAAFAMSVHNAASGLISIAHQNRGFTTSLAADYDTPAAAVTEAIGLVLTHGVPVVVACGDEAAPPSLVRYAEPWDLLAAAVVLAPLGPVWKCIATLTLEAEAAPSIGPADLPARLACNPQAGAVDLVDALRRAAEGVVRLDRGQGRGLCARIGRCGDR
jgi:hypothetical protein